MPSEKKLQKEKTDFLLESSKKRKMFKTAKFLIKVGAGILVALFSWLQMFKIGAAQTTQFFSEFFSKFYSLNLQPNIVDDVFYSLAIKMSLCLYFSSWTIGSVSDLDYQEDVLLCAPNNGKLGLAGWTVILSLIALFGALCLFHDSPTLLAVAFNIFFIADFCSWLFFKFFIQGALIESKKQAEGIDNDLCLRITVIDRFLFGNWRKIRFVIGGSMLCLANWVAFSNISISIKNSDYYLKSSNAFALVLFLFLAVMELSHWYHRIKRKFFFQAIKELSETAVS